MEIYDVVKKLVGEIDPIGESQTDAKRYENLVVMTKLVDQLLTDLDEIAVWNKDRVEHSRRKAGEFAYKFFTQIVGISE